MYQISSIRNQENKWWNKLKFRKKFKLLSPLSLLLFNIKNQENKRLDLVIFFQMPLVRLSLSARVSLKAYNKKFHKKFKLLYNEYQVSVIMYQENKRWDLQNFVRNLNSFLLSPPSYLFLVTHASLMPVSVIKISRKLDGEILSGIDIATI